MQIGLCVTYTMLTIKRTFPNSFGAIIQNTMVTQTAGLGVQRAFGKSNPIN
jgi:hypothetical protein